MTIAILAEGADYTLAKSSTIDATGANSTDPFWVGGYGSATFQTVHAAHTAGVTIYEWQSSNDKVNWNTILGSSHTTSSASGSAQDSFTDFGAWVRLTITTANATDPSPTFQGFVNAKGV